MFQKPNPQNANIGKVKVIRHHWSKNIRLHVKSDGTVVVTAPKLAPKILINSAVVRHSGWIKSQQQKLQAVATTMLKHGDKVGKSHILEFINDGGLEKPRSQIKNNIIRVKLPSGVAWQSDEAQACAAKAQTRALRDEAEEYLPGRLSQLASHHGYNYSSVRIRKLERRWGSCTQKKDITFNLQLMSLPSELIDYVILHELAHTKHLHHQANFWAEMSRTVPNHKELRRQLRGFRV